MGEPHPIHWGSEQNETVGGRRIHPFLFSICLCGLLHQPSALGLGLIPLAFLVFRLAALNWNYTVGFLGSPSCRQWTVRVLILHSCMSHFLLVNLSKYRGISPVFSISLRTLTNTVRNCFYLPRHHSTQFCQAFYLYITWITHFSASRNWSWNGELPYLMLKHVTGRGWKDSKEIVSRCQKRGKKIAPEAAVLGHIVCWQCRSS